MSWLMGPADGGRGAAAIALGREPADLVVTGGRLVNVYSGEVLDGWDVAVAGDEGAWVGPGPWPGDAAERPYGPDCWVAGTRSRSPASAPG